MMLKLKMSVRTVIFRHVTFRNIIYRNVYEKREYNIKLKRDLIQKLEMSVEWLFLEFVESRV